VASAWWWFNNLPYIPRTAYLSALSPCYTLCSKTRRRCLQMQLEGRDSCLMRLTDVRTSHIFLILLHCCSTEVLRSFIYTHRLTKLESTYLFPRHTTCICGCNMFSLLFPAFGNEMLHSLVDQPLAYIAPAMLLLAITIFSTSRVNKRQLTVPFFGNEDGNPVAMQKRWITDSMNFLREGFVKVLGLTIYICPW